jgi:hypothetical protein
MTKNSTGREIIQYMNEKANAVYTQEDGIMLLLSLLQISRIILGWKLRGTVVTPYLNILFHANQVSQSNIVPSALYNSTEYLWKILSQKWFMWNSSNHLFSVKQESDSKLDIELTSNFGPTDTKRDFKTTY